MVAVVNSLLIKMKWSEVLSVNLELGNYTEKCSLGSDSLQNSIDSSLCDNGTATSNRKCSIFHSDSRKTTRKIKAKKPISMEIRNRINSPSIVYVSSLMIIISANEWQAEKKRKEQKGKCAAAGW